MPERSTTFLIYGLCDPRTGELRYVGKSSSGLHRPRQHFQAKALKTWSPKNMWIRGLKSLGKSPTIEILEEHETGRNLADAERFWIAAIRATGASIYNRTDGGDGQSYGFIHSVETKAKMSVSQKARGTNGLCGYKQTEAHRRAIAEGGKGKKKSVPRTVEHSRNVAKARGGKQFTDVNGNLYYTIPEAAKATGFHYSTIQRALKGRTSNNAFRYLEGT